jgi:two-component system, NarL family, nitrate/nitrite response regulator NarL
MRVRLPPVAAANREAVRGELHPAQRVDVFVLAGLRLYREGVAAALAEDGRFRVVGTSADGAAALARLAEVTPTVVLVEIGDEDGPGLVRTIRDHAPDSRIVALGVSGEEADVLPLAEAGIAGWLTRDASVDDLRVAVASAAAGEAICTPRMAMSLLRRVAALAADRGVGPHATPLTRREREIVALIDEGLSNKEIARRLSIELATVKNHVHNILEKLHVTRRADAAALVREPVRPSRDSLLLDEILRD